MTHIADPPRAAVAGAPGRSVGDGVRFVLRGLGQTMITAGLVVLLFLVYEVWVTTLFSERANHAIAHKLEQEWVAGDNPLLPLPGSSVPAIAAGTGIANLYMPRLGADYQWAIVQGTDQADLALGPGHYDGTALPGQIGNFAVAGHRVGKGNPFLDLDRLRSGDAVIVQTRTWWYVYRVKGHPLGGDPQGAPDADGIPGRQIVDPGDGGVLLPVPDHPGVAPSEALMTMTTCNPKFTAENRMIVYARLAERVRAHGLRRPASISSLFAASAT